MKRKVLSLVLVLAMVMSLGVTAFATTEIPPLDPPPVNSFLNDSIYVVQDGDTLEGIALDWYGTIAVCGALRAYNVANYLAGNGSLKVGANFYLPEILCGYGRLPALPDPATENIIYYDANHILVSLQHGGFTGKLYKVVKGDTLLSIIARYYPGHSAGLLLKYVAKANAGRVMNVNKIWPGQTIILPVITIDA